MKYTLISLTTVLLATSCQQQITPTVYGTLDAGDKRIAVPMHNIGNAELIKIALRNDGWNVTVSGSTTGKEQQNNTTTITFDNAQSRYTLYWKQDLTLGYDFWSGPNTMIPYTTISIYENKTGQEILNYNGAFILTPKRVKVLTDTIRRITR